MKQMNETADYRKRFCPCARIADGIHGFFEILLGLQQGCAGVGCAGTERGISAFSGEKYLAYIWLSCFQKITPELDDAGTRIDFEKKIAEAVRELVHKSSGISTE